MPVISAIADPSNADRVVTRRIKIEGFEQLRAATPTTTSEIVQLEAGRMQGELKHATVAGLSLGFGTFSRGLLSRGVYSTERLTIGFRLRRSRSVRHGIGSVRFWLPGAEHETRYAGAASFGGISVAMQDMADFLGPDSRFGDGSIWRERQLVQADRQAGAGAEQALRSIMSSFDRGSLSLTQAEAVFWKRAILEAATSVMIGSQPEDTFVSSPARLVKRVQEYLERAGSAPVHISELLSVLRVSRRTLHRAFDEVLGIPPMTYLRRRRLCAARILLTEAGEASVTVADVAFKHGFSDFGRFSGYYRSLFGENPAETLRSARQGAS
jgi:AraC-like DNA-binding protein